MVRDSSGRILLAGTGRPPDSLVVRLRANGAPRHALRQRRPDLPGARPAARRHADLHPLRRDRRRRLEGRHRRLRGRPGHARRARSAARSTPAASRSPSRDCSNPVRGATARATSCSGFISTLRSTRTPSRSISTFGCAAANELALDPQRAQEDRVVGLHPGVEHALRRGVDLGGARPRREVGEDVELGLAVQRQHVASPRSAPPTFCAARTPAARIGSRSSARSVSHSAAADGARPRALEARSRPGAGRRR